MLITTKILVAVVTLHATPVQGRIPYPGVIPNPQDWGYDEQNRVMPPWPRQGPRYQGDRNYRPPAMPPWRLPPGDE